MGKTKEEKSLDAQLWKVYKEQGVKQFLAVCSEMLKIRDKQNWEKKKHANGEVCEVVLAVLTHNYFTKKRMTGEVFQSVVLLDKDRGKSSDFRTELDFIALTPGVCLTGECKSFVGDTVVTGDCTLQRGDLTADVYKQSVLHVTYLKKYLSLLTSVNPPPLGMFCFLYSNGSVTDNRTVQKKQTLPVLTVGTLYQYYDRIFSRFSGGVYNYEQAKSIFLQSQNSIALHRQHRDFVGY